jgi:hypothetical protein
MMTHPGFTADAALDHNVDRYRGAADGSPMQPIGGIIPAGIWIGWGSECDGNCPAAPLTGGWCWCSAWT